MLIMGYEILFIRLKNMNEKIKVEGYLWVKCYENFCGLNIYKIFFFKKKCKIFF